ncbi:peptidase U62, partial [Enterococcus hirae]
RALLGASWGFAATNDLTDRAVDDTGRQATLTARASARVPGSGDLRLADVPVAEDHWETPVAEDPFAMSVSEPVDLVTSVSATMHAAGV